MAMGSTQSLTEMSTRNISWGVNGGRCVGLTTLPPSCADCLETWEPQPPGTLRPVMGMPYPLPSFPHKISWRPYIQVCLYSDPSVLGRRPVLP
jgi:hypothetical protein